MRNKVIVFKKLKPIRKIMRMAKAINIKSGRPMKYFSWSFNYEIPVSVELPDSI